MARARNLKPGFFKNEELAELGPLAMLLFEGLWCLADKEGRLEDRPKRIKAEIFPYFDADVDALLNALSTRGFVVRYEAAGSRVMQVVNFCKHQRPHSNEVASIIPEPTALPIKSEGLATKVESAANQGEQGFGLIPDTLSTDSLIPDTPLTERDAPKARRRVNYPADFELVWSAYPRGHGDKEPTYRAWLAVPEGERPEILVGVERWKHSERWQRGVILAAERFIKLGRWREPIPDESARASPNGAPTKRATPEGFARLAGMETETTR